MLITYDQMWRRYKTLKKQREYEKDPEIRCDICGKVIHLNDKDVDYSKTSRGTELFFHRKCLKNW